jgi:hypothetical protein
MGSVKASHPCNPRFLIICKLRLCFLYRPVNTKTAPLNESNLNENSTYENKNKDTPRRF